VDSTIGEERNSSKNHKRKWWRLFWGS